MKNVLLIGLGRFGKYMALKLSELGHDVIVVDKLEERVNEVVDSVTSARIGDATSEDFLKSLGVSDFDLCIVAVGNSILDSLEITSLLKELGGKQVVSRATGKTQEKFLLRNGADSVVFPEKQLASWAAVRYTSDNIDNFIEVSDGYAIFEVRTPSQWDGKSIREIEARDRYGIVILGIRDESMHMNPSSSAVLHQEDWLLAFGKYEEMHKLFHI